VEDPLRALGVVLLGPEAPVVLCAVDWCGLRNDAHRAWVKALAEAAHTTPGRVAVQCVHPHDAPFADTRAQELIGKAKGPPSLDLAFFSRCVEKTAAAVKKSLASTEKVTHLATGQAKVSEVASNRRVVKDGKVKFSRTSTTRDPVARAEPEGLIDPWLKTLSFWREDRPLAALHYYATHPMSRYGAGRVSSDFCGLARDERSSEEKSFQAYFTGCAGNVTAGKYNDGDVKNRGILKGRILDAMRSAWKASKKEKVDGWSWAEREVTFAPRPEKPFGEAASKAALEDEKATKARRNNAAFQLAWLERVKRPVTLSCLKIGSARVVHLPGEPFIEYQLFAQKAGKGHFVCVAGYGDGGMGYIPTDTAFLEGGYEPTVALAAPCQKKLEEAIEKLLTS
jgi:hypothetical protein